MPSPNPKTKKEQLFLLSQQVPYEHRAARGPLAAAYELGGLHGLLLMALCRERQGLYSTLDEVKELQKILKWCMYQLEKADREARAGEPSIAQRAESSHALLVARSKVDREARERSHLERCVGRPSGNPARLQSECRVIRPATEVADRVLAELAAQGPTPLLEEVESTPEINDESGLDQARDACLNHPAGCSDSRSADGGECTAAVVRHRCSDAIGTVENELPVTPEPAPTRDWSYSRQTKGECGIRIGFLLDRVLHEIRNTVFEDESTWEEPEFPYELANSVLEELRSSVDPPLKESVTLDAGAGDVAEVVISDAGASEVTAEPSQLDGDSAWSLLCAVPDFAPSDLEELASALDQHPEMHSIGLVAAIGRAKLTMSGISSWSKPDEPITIGAGDLLVLLRSALRGVK